MNKNTLLLSLVAIVTIALAYTFIESDEISQKNYQKASKQSTTITSTVNSSNINIEYENSKTDIKKQNVQKKKAIPKHEKYLETWVKDKSKKFEIALYNPNQDLSRNDGRYRNIQGTVDGHYFNLPVPLHLIQEGSGDIKLRIRNLETNESTYTTAAFIDDMTLPAMHHKLTINSKDPDNYQQTSEKQVPPPRPGM